MVDIDEAVTTFCKEHLQANTAAFEDSRLELINDDARSQLEQYPGKFDVIIGDLADPVEGGPCYQVGLTTLSAIMIGRGLGQIMLHVSAGHMEQQASGIPFLQLYTQEFYETVIKAKLNPGGVFVTQSGPAGVLSSSQVK